MSDYREVWQRGPVDGVPALLQPVAHALLQAAEDASKYAGDLPDDLLWERPGGVASPGFHLLHIKGVIDRLFTYARGEALTSVQLQELAIEKESSAGVSASRLLAGIRETVARAIDQLKATPEETLTHARTIGRKKLPTTVGGLLFHAAEHAQRHIGQLLVTVRIIMERNPRA